VTNLLTVNVKAAMECTVSWRLNVPRQKSVSTSMGKYGQLSACYPAVLDYEEGEGKEYLRGDLGGDEMAWLDGLVCG